MRWSSAQFDNAGPLAHGGSYTSKQTVTLPVGVSGSFYFLVQTDVNGQVFQNGLTADNLGATTTAETVNLTPPPDLDVTSITAPATALAGHGLTFTYQVSNVGAGSTPNDSWEDAYFLSPTPTYDADTAISLNYQTHSGSLDAGASYTSTSPRPCPTA